METPFVPLVLNFIREFAKSSPLNIIFSFSLIWGTFRFIRKLVAELKTRRKSKLWDEKFEEIKKEAEKARIDRGYLPKRPIR